MKILKQSLLISSLIFSMGQPTLAQASPNDEAFILRATDQLYGKWKDIIYDFSDLALKKYCPNEYKQAQDMLRQIKIEDPSLGPVDLQNRRNLFIQQNIGNCPNSKTIVDLEKAFNSHMRSLTKFTIELIEEFVLDPNSDLEVDGRHRVAEVVLKSSLEENYEPARLFELLDLGNEAVEVDPSGRTETSTVAAVLPYQLAEAAHGIPHQAQASAQTEVPAPETKKPVKKGHCQFCRKKLILPPFLCACDGEFCITHRHPEDHACTVDRQAAEKALLAKKLMIKTEDKFPDKI